MTVTLSMALPRKYSGFNLSHAVPVPTQLSARLVPMVRLELTHPFGYQILSLGCLPIPSQRHISRSMFATSDSGPLFFQLAVSAKRGKRGFEVLTAAMSASRITSNLLVGIVGLEPTRPLGHQILSLARLPIPSYPHKCGFQVWFRKPDQHTHFEGLQSPIGSIT